MTKFAHESDFVLFSVAAIMYGFFTRVLSIFLIISCTNPVFILITRNRTGVLYLFIIEWCKYAIHVIYLLGSQRTVIYSPKRFYRSRILLPAPFYIIFAADPIGVITEN